MHNDVPSVYYPTDSERFAASAWRRLNLEPPADLQKIADFLGITVVKELLSPDLHGVYMRTKSGEAEIRVNSGLLPVERQRFIMAHEIGHHLFSRKIPGSITVEFRNGIINKHLERACDRFAVCVLMPAEEVRKVAEELHHSARNNKMRNMADRFGVSAQAMTLRLRELGLDYQTQRYMR
jgi:Zn-dependent peptidase ImmA (M78 family)